MALTNDYEKVYTYRHRDWSGGQNDRDDSTMLANKESQYLYYATTKYKNTLYPCEGITPLYASVFSEDGIDGLGVYHHDNGEVYILAAIGNTIYYDTYESPSGMQVLSSEFTASEKWCFKQFMGEVYISNGIDPLYKWDGYDVQGVSERVFYGLEVHQNRLWGIEEDSVVAYTTVLDGSDWDALQFFQFNPEESDEVVRIQRFGSNLIVFKEKSKALIVGDTFETFGTVWLEGTGTAGLHAVSVNSSYAYKLTPEGVELYDFMRDMLVSDRIEESWDDINSAYIYKAAFEMDGNYLYIAVPTTGNKVNTVVWQFNTVTGAWIKYPNQSISAWNVVNNDGEKVLLGADGFKGQIYKFVDSSSNTDAGGEYIQYEWRSPDFTFGESNRYKLYKNLYIEMDGVAEESTLYLRLYADGVAYPSTGNIELTVPAGEGTDRNVRLIPPMYGAVMGRTLGLYLKGRVGIKSVTIEYAFRGAVPPGSVV